MGRYGVLWSAMRLYGSLWGAAMGRYGVLWGAMGCNEAAVWGAMEHYGMLWDAMGQHYGGSAVGQCYGAL